MPIATRTLRHYGGVTTTESQYATPVVSTSNCTRYVAQLFITGHNAHVVENILGLFVIEKYKFTKVVRNKYQAYGGSLTISAVIKKQKPPYARRDKPDLQYERFIVQ